MPSSLDVRVGFYLARRQLRRSSWWASSLIVFVMLLTFLNLVVVTGILVGLVEGISDMYRVQEIGDVQISALDTKNYIEHAPEILALVRSLPQVEVADARYIAASTIEANYQEHTSDNDKPNATGAEVAGIDVATEEAFSNIQKNVHEGAFLAPGDFDTVVLGSQLVDRYSFGKMPGLTPLKNVYPGTKVRLTIAGNTREMTVKGIIVTTANSASAARIFMPADELRTLLGRSGYETNTIAIRLKPGVDPVGFRDLLLRSGVGDSAKVQTFDQAIPNGIADVKNTFAILGNAFSSIGLVVASITIFIVIFINALTRRKYIGIMKGIGITGAAIEISYFFAGTEIVG